MKYYLAIFDLDGTILNTIDDIANSVNYALQLNSMPIHTTDEITSYVGNGVMMLIKRALPKNADEEIIKKVYDDFNEHYRIHNNDLTAPYNKIPETIQTLRNAGVKTAVISNKIDYGVKALCKQYFDGMFDFAVGERQGIAKKPSPDSVNEVLNLLDISPDNAVFIGDSEVDIETAENAGLDCISVSWGFKDKEFLKSNGAKIIIDKPEQLLKLIL